MMSIAVAFAIRNSSVCCWSVFKTFSKYGYTRSSTFHNSASNRVLTGLSCGLEDNASKIWSTRGTQVLKREMAKGIVESWKLKHFDSYE